MPDLELWSAEQAVALEPALRCTAALWSPTTGVVDSHGLMLAYQGDAEAHGAMVAFESPLERAEVTPAGIILDVGGAEPMQLLAPIASSTAPACMRRGSPSGSRAELPTRRRSNSTPAPACLGRVPGTGRREQQVIKFVSARRKVLGGH